MKLLSLSTAEQGCSLAIIEDNTLICEEYWATKQTHSKRLVKMIDHMFEKRAGLALDDIEVFVAARGPGSFTGLRIGISVIKGIAYAIQRPAMGVSSLDGIAFRFVHSSIPVCAMMDAKRNEVYCAIYHFDHGRLISKTQERVVSPQDAIKMTKEATLFAGSGSKVYREIIEQKADNPKFSDKSYDFVSATALVRSLNSKENFSNQPGNILTPTYIRKSDAQLQFVEK
ncbi:MAG: tRNA (adenosine(37)-N6)-threonylcarbamoyltransferase complex dimerization subunit type 1 TsaB [Desulfobacteraceae bacterium]|nr:tRNA (adenosine(37)-N6)-threonylcarbamoyltransferase complex dimerization subunit type 1 TsaB [Desulfobacteraceae bacterium]